MTNRSLDRSSIRENMMPRRAGAPETHRHRAAVRPRRTDEPVSLHPLGFDQALRGLLAVKPERKSADTESGSEEEVSEDG